MVRSILGGGRTATLKEKGSYLTKENNWFMKATGKGIKLMVLVSVITTSLKYYHLPSITEILIKLAIFGSSTKVSSRMT